MVGAVAGWQRLLGGLRDRIGDLMSRAFTPAWLAGEAIATGFLGRGFSQPEARAAAVQDARARPVEPAVMAAIMAQESLRPMSEARTRNLALLAQGAAAVVTGQQVGLFLGPLYTLHKAASAVVDARALSEATGHPVVPVFWLQTEDHDFAEVRSTTLPTASGLTTVSVDDELGPDARVSLSERRLGPSVTAALAAAGLQGAFAAEVTALLERHYHADATWADAFANTLAELFADHGLILFDPRAAASKAEIARLSAPLHAFLLGRAEAIHGALAERIRALTAAGFDVQVPVRAGAALSCYAATDDAPRHRLERAGDAWTTKHLGDSRLADSDIEVALAEAPQRFTTTALSRPLLQDTLLPTVAYVGGPGELAYFAQLAPLYELAGRTMPLAVLRARFTLVTATARRLAEQLGLGLADASLPKAELAQRLAQRQGDFAPIEAQHRSLDEALSGGLAALEIEAEKRGDGGFGKHAKKTAEVVRAALERLLERSRRLALEADATTSERLTRFLALLAPHDAPQERVLGFASFAAQVGPKTLVDSIVASVTPFDGTPKVIDL